MITRFTCATIEMQTRESGGAARTSSILGPAPPSEEVGAAPGAPPSPWYILVMMGLHVPSRSFSFASSSSTCGKGDCRHE